MGSLLDREDAWGVYCARNTPGRYVCQASEEATMERDEKTGKVTTTIQEVEYYNMLLTEAILELLAEKGVLTGEEVLERVKKLKRDNAVTVPVAAVVMPRLCPCTRPSRLPSTKSGFETSG
jgi:hypothetical protein